MNFSFDNTKVAVFFSGEDSDPPIDELIYLHTHPLIRPNFLVELDELVIMAGHKLKAKNMSGYPVQELIRIATEIGKALPTINSDNALSILLEMRNLKNLCVGLLNS